MPTQIKCTQTRQGVQMPGFSPHPQPPRIVAHGDHCLQAIIPNSAKAFNFATAFRLTEEQVRKPRHLGTQYHLSSNVPMPPPLPSQHLGKPGHLVSPQALAASDHYPVEVMLSCGLPQPLTPVLLLLPAL